ncbi:NACHT domain-containing protein [Pedobacter psychrodurus]|uniref:NACHT domain-containing protein n=1 Tax=Pedobacter psychrodurus TaxID=2530456 RepID=UPI00292DE9E0|nr:NACHT domain-containing protein [Pedobacter psychrodurus]
MIEKIIPYLKGFNLDIKSVLLTLIALPLLMVIRRVVIRYVKEWGEYTIDGVMYLLSRYIKQSVASSLSLRRYCKLQLGNDSIKYLHIPSSRDLTVDIDKFFVNLTISHRDENENEFNQYDFLTIGNRVKVMGDPGSGKSSLIKMLLRNTCRLGLKKPRKAKLPFLVELKNVIPPTKTKDYGEWFFNYIKQEISKNKVYKIQECFDNYSLNRGLLILLDGLDEVSSANYSRISDCINGLHNYLKDLNENNSIVLTMRTQFYQQIKVDYASTFPHSTFLKPFTPSDIYEFLTRWSFEKDSENNISRVYRDLTDKPTLREMCSNPLILSMYVAEDQNSKGAVSPESRTQFYKKITEELIIKRRLMQKSNIPSAYSALKEQREKILGKIAFEHLTDIEQSSNSLKYKNAIKTIREILQCDFQKAEAVFDEISKETGLITEERQKETFRFIHLTFCEFLAAFEASQGINDGWNKLLKFHRNFLITAEEKSRLIEVIPFTAGLLPRIQREQALYDVAKLSDSTLMSRCFLETKLYSHKTWPDFIADTKNSLLVGRKAEINEKWLQDLHVFNVVVRDANLSSESINTIETIDLNDFYENLVENDKISLNGILSSFAIQDAAAVFRLAEVCNINLRRDFPALIIQNADQLALLGQIKDRMLNSNQKELEEWAALLSEAAITKKLVSVTLDDQSYDDKLESKIKGGKYRIWYHKNILSKTLLTQCLTLSSTFIPDNKIFRCLSLLQQLKAPSEVNFLFLFKRTLLFFILIPALLMMVFPLRYFTLLPKKGEIHSTLMELIGFMLLYLTTLIMMLYIKDTRTRYRKVINIDLTSIDNSNFIKVITFIDRFGGITFASKKENAVIKDLIKLRGDDLKEK